MAVGGLNYLESKPIEITTEEALEVLRRNWKINIELKAPKLLLERFIHGVQQEVYNMVVDYEKYEV